MPWLTGRSYCVTSQRSLITCLDSVVQKIQGGVVIHFEKFGPDPQPITPEETADTSDKENVTGSILSGALTRFAPHDQDSNSDPVNPTTNGDVDSKSNWTSCRKLIYVQRSAQKGYSVGHWPIPESFWPDLNCPSLPPRTAHPQVKFSCVDTVPMVIDSLPFDKYELEPSPLTRVILNRKAAHVAWQCFVTNSGKGSEIGSPFAYLKASSNLSCVNLFVLPYDYPKLLPLLDELLKSHNMKPSREWKAKFDLYMQNLPLYYAPPLKRALQRLGLPATLVPDTYEIVMSPSVMNYLKRVKNQAKTEYDKSCGSVGYIKAPTSEVIRVANAPKTKKILDMALVCNFSHDRFSGIKSDLNEFQGFHARTKDKFSDTKSQSYRNAYDINRHELLDQIQRMRMNFLLPPAQIRMQDEDQMHSLPVAQMGNYQEYLKRIPPPLRELESAPVRQHMFGNPFKIDKKGSGVSMVDEADVDLLNENSGPLPPRSPKRANPGAVGSTIINGGPNRNKRKPGPIPKDLNYRPSSPTPPSSPSDSNQSNSGQSNSSLIASDITEDIEMSGVPILESESLTGGDDEVFNEAKGDSIISLTPSNSESESEYDSDKMEVEPMATTSDDSNVVISNGTHEEDDDVEEVYSLIRKGNHNIEYVPEHDTSGAMIQRSQSFTYAKSNGSVSTPTLSNHVYLNGDATNTRVKWSPEETQIKKEMINIAKRPGKACYKDLSDRLEAMADNAFRSHLLYEIKDAARRFKRKQLINYLNQKFSGPGHHHRHLSNNFHHHPSSSSTHQTGLKASSSLDVQHHQKLTKTSMLKEYAG